MNTISIAVFAGLVAVASAGLLGAPLTATYGTYAAAPVAYAQQGQISSQVNSFNSGTYKNRVSQSAHPVAYAAAPAYAAHAIAAPAYATHAVAAPAYATHAVAAPAYATHAVAAPAYASGHIVQSYGYTPAATALLG